MADATVMARNAKWPLSLDEKPKVLRKLQGSIHFEKTLTASSASGYRGLHSRLALPFSFVRRHGDKFRKSVILRTGSPTEAWPVTTDICFMSPACSQVKFSGGWGAFANFHGLLKGDSLIFSLTALSEFKVYVFRSPGSPTGLNTSRVQRNGTYDSKISQKKAAKQSSERRNEKSAADGSIDGTTVKSSGLHTVKKTLVAEERAAEHSKSNLIDHYSSGGHHDSKKGQEPALDHDEIMASGASGGRKNPGNEYQGPTRSEVLRKLQGKVHFEKTITASSASGYLGQDSRLAMPLWFVRRHGDKFRRSVILRTELSTKEWPVKLTISYSPSRSPHVKLCGGWRGFANFNGLLAGDSLIFSLVAISEFEVHVFPGTGSPNKLSSQPGPRKCSIDSGLPRKKAKQSYDCENEQLSAEECVIREVKFNEWTAQRRTTGEQRAVSAFGNSPTSLRNSSYRKDGKSKNVAIESSSRGHRYDLKKEQERALDLDEEMVAGARGGRGDPRNEYQDPTIFNLRPSPRI